MYYYIFDIRQCKNKAQGERIKDYLAELGISGEYVFPSQARSVKELVGDALGRDFSTIVAIGNDSLINNVASELIGQKAAFGIIPLNASQQIVDLVNGSDWRQAAVNLRFRKIHEIKLGQFENGRHFLTQTHLAISSSVNITLEFDEFIAQTRAKRLIISNINPKDPRLKNNLPDGLDIHLISDESGNSSILEKLFTIFDSTKQDDRLNKSYFRVPRLRVFSHKNLNFIIDKEIIASTPQLIKVSPGRLRLIVNREALQSS